MSLRPLLHPVVPAATTDAPFVPPTFRIDADVLRQGLADLPDGGALSVFHFPWPDGTTRSLQTRTMESIGTHGRAWHGAVSDDPTVYAFLGIVEAEDGFHLAGTLYEPGGYHTLEPAGTDHVAMYSRPYGAVGGGACECGDPPLVRLPVDRAAYDAEFSEADAGIASIEMLGLYPTAALSKVTGGESAIRAIANSFQVAVNAHFQNSGIPARVTLHIQEHTAFHATDVTGLQREVVSVLSDRDIANDTNFIRGPSYTSVAAVRDTLQADVVALMATEPTSGTNFGISSCIPQPPSAGHSSLDYAVFSSCILLGWSGSGPTMSPQQVFVHELGHLLGGQHSRVLQSDIVLDPAYDFARGYVSPDGLRGTVMAYPVDMKQGSYIPGYSAADRLWQGHAMGVSADHRDASGHPNGADCATLFRLSTRQMARYRGKSHPGAIAPLHLASVPVTGGLLVPAIDGPYPVGTTLTVVAAQHVGHVFERWEFNGKVVGTVQPSVQITLGAGENRLVAHFAVKQEMRHTLSIDQASLPEGARIEVTPPNVGPHPWGTLVQVRYIPATVPDYATWVGGGPLSVTRLATGTPLTLRMLVDYAGVGVKTPRVVAQWKRYSASFASDRAVPVRGEGHYTWYVEDVMSQRPLEGRTLHFSVETAGSTAKPTATVVASAVSDAQGRVRMAFHAGETPGALRFRATLEPLDHEVPMIPFKLSDEIAVWDPQTHPLPMTSIALTLDTPAEGQQACVMGQLPKPVNVRFWAGGKPRTLYTPAVALDAGGTGIKLAGSPVRTDLTGRTRFTFTSPTRMGVACLDFGEGYRAWIKVLPAELSSALSIAPPVVRFEVNAPPAPLTLALDPRLISVTENREAWSDLSIHLALDDGGTGLGLVTTVVSPVDVVSPLDKVLVWFRAPTSTGQAFLRLTMPPCATSITVPIEVIPHPG